MNKDVGRGSVFGDLMPETKGQKVTWASTAAEAVATKATAILLNKVATGTKEE